MGQTHVLRFENRKIAKLYKDVPVEQVERLHQFRADHPYQHTVISGVRWQYVDAGKGSTTLLMLPGALATAESNWQTIAHFADRQDPGRYRVISPSYPPSITTMAELVDGVAGVLDKAGVSKADVLGGSAGGFVAQVFVRRHPDKTEKLLISHAGTPKPERGRKIARALRWLPLLPMGVLRALVKKRLTGLLPKGRPETAFIHAYVLETVNLRLTKRWFLSILRRGADFDLHYTFTPQDLGHWPGEILLIMADDDPTTPEPMRNAMKALYPQAKVHMFHGTGHAAAILRQEEHLSVIEAFVRDLPG